MGTKTTYIGGRMYGDGEYSVEFSGIGGVLAPLKAYVIGPGLDGVATVDGFATGDKAGVALATMVIARVRMEVSKDG